LQTRERRAKAATSATAVWSRIFTRISDGTMEIGHDDVGDRSVGGSSTGMGNEAKEAMSCDAEDAGGPSKGRWTELGTVTAAFDIFGFAGNEEKEESGKCLFL